MQDLLNKNLPSDEESDEEYVPTTKELNEDENRDVKRGPHLMLNRKRALHEIIKEMKEDWNQSLKQLKNKEKETAESLNINEIIEKVNRDLPKAQVIKFAGKTFDLNDNNECKLLEGPSESQGPTETPEKPAVDESGQESESASASVPAKVTMRQKTEYLKSLLKVIDAKNINSMTKSRYDWKDYTKKENMEKQFSENRKDGYLDKKMFLEKSKQEEKDYMKGRKKLKS